MVAAEARADGSLARQDGATLIEGTDLGIRRAGRWLIDGVDIAVRAGEIVTVIGPNGGGKTTLLRTLLGLVAPDRGRVTRKGGLKLGYVPQKLQIDWTLPLSVSRLMTLTERAPRQAVAAALAETGVEHLAGRAVQTLSGGEFQRVLLARALLRDPDILFLDEPVQGVDFSGEVALYELIGAIRRRRGCGILLVSHDLHVVMAATDRVLCLNGHVCCAGQPREVTRHPAYLDLFGPRAAGVVAVYHHHHDHAHDITGEPIGGAHAHDHRHDHDGPHPPEAASAGKG